MAPLPETADAVHDYFGRMRGIDSFLKGTPAASLPMLMKGIESIGADAAHRVVIFDKLIDAKSLYLTANPSTMCVLPNIYLLSGANTRSGGSEKEERGYRSSAGNWQSIVSEAGYDQDIDESCAVVRGARLGFVEQTTRAEAMTIAEAERLAAIFREFVDERHPVFWPGFCIAWKPRTLTFAPSQT